MLKKALKISSPVMLGYIPTGIALGLLANSFKLDWYIAPLMSVIVYSGAMQFLALTFFLENPGLVQVGITALVLNLRHSFFGLSLLTKFSNTGLVKPYLIFSLTDETYALLATTDEKEFAGNKKAFYFLISFLNHCYWIIGTTMGVFLGRSIDFNTKGLDFSLTALFTVLTVNQFKNRKSNIPFIISLTVGILCLIFISKNNMLLLSISISTVIVLMFRKKLQNEQ